MPAGAAWTKPEGGFYVWLKLPHGLDAKLMQPRAVNAHVAYVPGIGFFADGNGQRVHAAVLLLPRARPDPRGRAPAGPRHRGRAGPALHLRRGRHRHLPRDPAAGPRTDAGTSSDPPTATPTRTADERDRPRTGTRARRRAAPAARRRPRRRADLRARGQPLLGHPGVGGARPRRRRRRDPRRRRRAAARPRRRARGRGVHRPARRDGGGRRPAGRPRPRRRPLRRVPGGGLPARLGQACGEVRRPLGRGRRRRTGSPCRTARSASWAPAPCWT